MVEEEKVQEIRTPLRKLVSPVERCEAIKEGGEIREICLHDMQSWTG